MSQGIGFSAAGRSARRCPVTGGSSRWPLRWPFAEVPEEKIAPALESMEADPPSAVAADAVSEEVPQAAEELSESELAAKAEELNLPSLDSLGPDSDFSAFMAKDVPAQLRTLALRRLWRMNPVLANLDGLLDYGEDFTDKATVIANMQTAYQVGKGYRTCEPEAEDLEEPELAGADIADASPEPAEDAEAGQAADEAAEETGEAEIAPAPDSDPEEATAPQHAAKAEYPQS